MEADNINSKKAMLNIMVITNTIKNVESECTNVKNLLTKEILMTEKSTEKENLSPKQLIKNTLENFKMIYNMDKESNFS